MVIWFQELTRFCSNFMVNLKMSKMVQYTCTFELEHLIACWCFDRVNFTRQTERWIYMNIYVFNIISWYERNVEDLRLLSPLLIQNSFILCLCVTISELLQCCFFYWSTMHYHLIDIISAINYFIIISML